MRYVRLARREDISADRAEIGRRYCVARATRAEALRLTEGDTVFEVENQFRAAAEQLTRERRVSNIVFLARKRG